MYWTDIIMKGNIRVKFRKLTVKFLIGVKNRQIKLEREKNKALEETNSILSAYLALLVSKHGCVRVSKALIKDALSNSETSVSDGGDDYIISVSRKNVSLSKNSCFEEAWSSTPEVGADG